MAWKSQKPWQLYDAGGRRKYTNPAERQRFLDIAESYPPRENALCRLLVFTGCRISEALGVTRDRLDLTEVTVTLETLKKRQPGIFRSLPVPSALMRLLQSLAPAEDGRLWSMHRVTAWELVKTVMRRAGIAGPMACPRGLRHGFGIFAIISNVPLPTLRKWMGHASLSTTAIYLDAIGEEERSFARRMWGGDA